MTKERRRQVFGVERGEGRLAGAFTLAELVFHATVRQARRGHGNALVALGMNVLQTVVFLGAFFLLFTLLGLRGASIRGDFLLYLMSGIFLFLTHVKASGAVVQSEGPASPMMKHAPMNTAVAILAAALSALYLQTLSLAVVLFAVHVLWNPVVISDPVGAFAMFLLAWFSGVGVGLVLLALKPWFPNFVQIANTVYSRANMVFSGKMFVANTLPSTFLPYFTWNPLFHAIDQARGYTFVNYTPHYTGWVYPVIVSLILVLIGLMGEFYTKRHASISWSAGR
ncbi:ABC transporter permease [Jannaschia seohaensis]|uniref:ABC-type polysaccharide/polyol phosphate export permease n=1 Tax=Jannaschia seohaensis TaxID=475081 RepID=A0A2Y9BVW6_9RHOB|nr:ABC transporter permease [Jannaschia seohaensis]PWJ21774.1 ABC-type polysaccharide/polyol phosphate export permease [Jannaschia seohaensis]SSA38052.1 ABC-type polysaccharide/polyol phosphate export permease [Jannaschia seohaensis]